MRINLNLNLIIAAAAAATLAGCNPEQPAKAEEALPADGTPVTSVSKAEKNDGKPKAYVKGDTYFTAPALDGETIDLADHAGKPVLMMLYTENCPYCHKAAPAMEKMHKSFSGKGLKVLGLCIQDSREAAANFAKHFSLSFQMAYAARHVYKQYRARGVPFIFLLDSEHKVAAVWPGYTEEFDAQMEEAIGKALRK